MRKKERNLRSLDMRRTLLVTLPFAGALAFWQAYDGIIPLILRDTFHLGDTLAGAVMALDNVCALFLLPFFGSISDRCHSRLGRRTPFILVGSLLAALLIPLLAVADQMRSLPFFFTVLCLVLVVLSSYRSPCVALMPDVTPRPIRAKADAFNSLMAAASGVVILISISLAVPDVEHPNYMPVFLIISAIIILCTVLFAVFSGKRKQWKRCIRKVLPWGFPKQTWMQVMRAERKKKQMQLCAGHFLVFCFAYFSTSWHPMQLPLPSANMPVRYGEQAAEALPISSLSRQW